MRQVKGQNVCNVRDMKAEVSGRFTITESSTKIRDKILIQYNNSKTVKQLVVVLTEEKSGCQQLEGQNKHISRYSGTRTSETAMATKVLFLISENYARLCII